MDINRLFKAGDSVCGRVMRVLPEKEIGSPKQYMMKVLKDFTKPSLDELYPRLYRTTLNVNDLIPLDNITTTSLYVGYRIPLSLTNGLEILGIRNFSPSATGYGQINQPT